jgi:hypothetical protein
MNYYIARTDQSGHRSYFDTKARFVRKLYRTKNAGTWKVRDLEVALFMASWLDALVLTEGKNGLVTI